MPYYDLLKEAIAVIRGVALLPKEIWQEAKDDILNKWHLFNRHCIYCGRGPIGHDCEPAMCDDCHHNHEHGGEG